MRLFFYDLNKTYTVDLILDDTNGKEGSRWHGSDAGSRCCPLQNNFEEPYKFNPERFLNDEGNYQKSAMLRPFGVGKRQCLGQILAKKEIQIVLVFLFA
jgi:hypothetical protein